MYRGSDRSNGKLLKVKRGANGLDVSKLVKSAALKFGIKRGQVSE